MEWIAAAIFILGLIFLTVKYTKPMLWLIGIFIAIAATTGGIVWYIMTSDSRNTAAVDLSVTYSTSEESYRSLGLVEVESDKPARIHFPLKTKISNNSNRPLLKTSWQVDAYRQGYSKSIGCKHYSTDKIIEPDAAYTTYLFLPDAVYKKYKDRESSLVYKVSNVKCEFGE